MLSLTDADLRESVAAMPLNQIARLGVLAIVFFACTAQTPNEQPNKSVVDFMDQEEITYFFTQVSVHVRHALSQEKCSALFDGKFFELSESVILMWQPNMPPGLQGALGATVCPDEGPPRVTMHLGWSAFMGPYITAKTLFPEMLHVKMCGLGISSVRQEKIIDKEIKVCFPGPSIDSPFE